MRYTNVVTNKHGQCIRVTHDSGDWNINQWIPQGNNYLFNIKTADITMKTPAQKKNIYKVRVTCSTSQDMNDSGVFVFYGLNGGACNKTFKYNLQNTYTSSCGLISTEKSQTIDLEPTIPIKDAYSIQLQFLSPSYSNPDFEIDDVSLVFRFKGKR